MKRMDWSEFKKKYPGIVFPNKLFNKATEFIQKLKELHEFIAPSPFLKKQSILGEDNNGFSPEAIIFMLSLKKLISELSPYRDQDNFTTMLAYLCEIQESEFQNLFFLFFRICDQYQENIEQLFKKRLGYTQQDSSVSNVLSSGAEHTSHNHLNHELTQLINFFYVHKNELQETLYKFNALLNLFPKVESTNSVQQKPPTHPNSGVSMLPEELVLEIFSYVDTVDLAALLNSSKALSKVAAASFVHRFEIQSEQIVARLCAMKAREAYQFVKEYRLSKEYKALKSLVEHNMPMTNTEITCYILTRSHDNIPPLHRLIEAFNDTRIHYKARIHLLFSINQIPKFNGKSNWFSPFSEYNQRELFTRFIKNCTQIYLNYLPPENLLFDINGDLSHAPLSRFQFHQRHFDPPVFDKVNFFEADLSYTKINRGEFIKANLDKANCYGAEMTECTLVSASLENTNLQKANLTNANLSYAKLRNTNLRWANLAGAIFVNSVITGTDFTGANLIGAKFVNVDLRNIDLSQLNVEGCYLENVLLVPDEALDNLQNLEIFFSSFEQKLANHTEGSQQNLRRHMLEDLKCLLNSDSMNMQYKRAIVKLVYSYYPPEQFFSFLFRKENHPFKTLFETFGFVQKQNKSMNSGLALQEKVSSVFDELEQRIENAIAQERRNRVKDRVLEGLESRIQNEVQMGFTSLDLRNRDEIIRSIKYALGDELAQRTDCAIEDELKGRVKSQALIEEIRHEIEEELESLINKAIDRPNLPLKYVKDEEYIPIDLEDIVSELEQCFKEAPGLTHVNQICELSNRHLYLLHSIYYIAFKLCPNIQLKPFFVDYPQNNLQLLDRGTCRFASQIFDGERFDITLLQTIKPDERDNYLYGDEDYIIKRSGRDWNEVKLGGLLFSFCPGGKGSGECQVEIIDFQNRKLKSGYSVGVARYSSLRCGIFVPIDVTANYAATTCQSTLSSTNSLETKAAFELKQWTIKYIFATQKGPIPTLLSAEQAIAFKQLSNSSEEQENQEKIRRALQQKRELEYKYTMILCEELKVDFETSEKDFLDKLRRFKKEHVSSNEQEILNNALKMLKSNYYNNSPKEWELASHFHRVYSMPQDYFLSTQKVVSELCIKLDEEKSQEVILDYLLIYSRDTSDLNGYFVNYVITIIKKIPNPDPLKLIRFYASLLGNVKFGLEAYKINAQIKFWEWYMLKKQHGEKSMDTFLSETFLYLRANRLSNPLDPKQTYYLTTSEAMESMVDYITQYTNQQNAKLVAQFYRHLLSPTVTYNHSGIRKIIEQAFKNLQQSFPYLGDETTERKACEELHRQQDAETLIEEFYHRLHYPTKVTPNLSSNSQKRTSSFQCSSNEVKSALSTHGLFALTASGNKMIMEQQEDTIFSGMTIIN